LPSIHPEDLLTFVYLDEFQDDWSTLYPHDEDERNLWALENAIMSDPEGPPVMSGTGGLRKLRFGSTNDGVGKSGGCRVCYAYFPDHKLVLMVMAFAKNRQTNLTAKEKEGIREYLEFTKQWLSGHADKGSIR
jgi:hypothetical protein